MMSRYCGLFALFLILTGCLSADGDDRVVIATAQAQPDLTYGLFSTVSWPHRPKVTGWWRSPPDIQLCTESGVTTARLNRALEFWNRLGYTWGTVTVEDNTYTCNSGGRMGEISIILMTQEVISSDHLAITRSARMTATSEIIRSQIYINGYAAKKLLVLEHELGHALGWGHAGSSYHLMNSEWRLIGHRTRGIEHSRYIEENALLHQDEQP